MSSTISKQFHHLFPKLQVKIVSSSLTEEEALDLLRGKGTTSLTTTNLLIPLFLEQRFMMIKRPKNHQH